MKAKLLEVAERYVNAGLQVVCVHSHLHSNAVRRGKAPTHYGWQKSPLPWERLKAEIERVWSKEGACNIGVVMGRASGLVCVDVDERGWYDEHQMELGSPIVETTARGGLHLYYRYPLWLRDDEVLQTKSSAARIFRGVDILADGGSQVVTWPSVHASGDCQYVIERGLDLTDALSEADELPRWIVEKVMGASRKEPMEREVSAGLEAGGELDYAAARLALSDFPAAVQGDGGDLRTLKAALLCRDIGLSEGQVYELLASDYNGRCSPPWTQQELRDKVANAFRYGKKPQGIMSIEHAFDETPTVTEESPPLAYSKKHAVHNARVFSETHRGSVDCFDGQFVYYDTNEKRWKVISDAAVESLIFHDMSRRGGSELVTTLKVNVVSDTRKVLKMDLNKPRCIPDVHWRDKETASLDFITVSNGILDVASGELLNHSQDWFSFQSLPMVYNGEARCEKFLEFLNDIWDGDAELIESLRLWMGYCLLTSCNLEKFAVFKGASRAGKSTLAAVIESIVGRENTASTSLSLIGSDFGLENIMGKKIVVFQDAERASPDRMGVATERIKSLASNDPVGINRKGQSVVFQRMNVKVSFVCNKMPPFLNDENALTNRMIVFPFWKSFLGREDVGLKERLMEETQGIFNWALVGARRLLRGEKLFTSKRGLEAIDEITQQLDSVAGFVAECVEETDLEHNFVTGEEMWAAYREWCRDSARMTKNKQRFFMEVGAHPRLVARRGRTRERRGFRGIKLNSDVFSIVEDAVPF